MSGHTPGPWHISGDGGGIFANPNRPSVAIAVRYRDGVEFEANARLIAAAPDLLKALQDILADVGDAGSDGYVENSLHIDEVSAARAAIARATVSEGEG